MPSALACGTAGPQVGLCMGPAGQQAPPHAPQQPCASVLDSTDGYLLRPLSRAYLACHVGEALEGVEVWLPAGTPDGVDGQLERVQKGVEVAWFALCSAQVAQYGRK